MAHNKHQLFYFMKFFAPRRSYTFLGLWTQKIWLFERFCGNICLQGTQNLTKIQNFDFGHIATCYTSHMTPRCPKNRVPGVSNQPESKKFFSGKITWFSSHLPVYKATAKSICGLMDGFYGPNGSPGIWEGAPDSILKKKNFSQIAQLPNAGPLCIVQC